MSTTPIITIEHFGTWARLGNQMFQYAYLRSLSLEYGLKIQLPRLQSPFGYRQAQLFDAFDLQIDDLDNDFKYELYLSETTMLFDSNFAIENIPAKKNILFSGYFQTEKYFEKYKNIIKKDFTFAENIRVKGSIYMFRQRTLGKPVVAIHVRRTDNMHPGSPTVLVPEDFRKNALKYVTEKVGNCTVLIFSDDKKWCEKNLNYPNQIIVDGYSDFEELYIMSLCDHFIIGSSTYCKNKIVLIAKTWYSDKIAYGKPL